MPLPGREVLCLGREVDFLTKTPSCSLLYFSALRLCSLPSHIRCVAFDGAKVYVPSHLPSTEHVRLKNLHPLGRILCQGFRRILVGAVPEHLLRQRKKAKHTGRDSDGIKKKLRAGRARFKKAHTPRLKVQESNFKIYDYGTAN